MAGVTAADSLTAALRTTADTMVSEALFRNNELFPLFRQVPWQGGSTYNYKVHYAGNTSVGTYAEGDAVGVAGSQSYLTANWPEKHYKEVLQVTGHVYDQTRGGAQSAVFFNQIEREFTYAVNDMVDKITTDMLGSGTTAPVGIQGIVDSTGTIAGINPSTYTWWAAYEAAGAATTIAIADIDTALQSIRDPEYAGNTDLILTSHKQCMKIKGVYGNPGTTANSIQVLNGAGGYVINLGDYTDIKVGSIPVIALRDLTNSIILGIQRDTIEIAVMREVTIEPLAKTDDSDKWLMTWAGGLACRNRMKNWKITTLTA